MCRMEFACTWTCIVCAVIRTFVPMYRTNQQPVSPSVTLSVVVIIVVDLCCTVRRAGGGQTCRPVHIEEGEGAGWMMHRGVVAAGALCVCAEKHVRNCKKYVDFDFIQLV